MNDFGVTPAEKGVVVFEEGRSPLSGSNESTSHPDLLHENLENTLEYQWAEGSPGFFFTETSQQPDALSREMMVKTDPWLEPIKSVDSPGGGTANLEGFKDTSASDCLTEIIRDMWH